MEIQPLPQVSFAPSPPLSYSWDALAEALVSIANGRAKGDGSRTMTTKHRGAAVTSAAAAAGNGFGARSALASQNAPPSHARAPLRSGGRGADAALKSPPSAAASSSSPASAAAATAAADESLPTGMQLLCSVAWTQVHSPPPSNRARLGATTSVTRTPQQSQSQQLWSPFASPSRSPVPIAASSSPFVSPTPLRRTQLMSPPASSSSSSSAYARPSPATAASASASAAAAHFRSPNRFTAPDSDEEEDEDGYSDRSDAGSEEDESDRSREDANPRMQAESTLDFGSAAHHATLADLTAVAQQMPRAFDPSVFHSASFSVDPAHAHTKRSPTGPGRRAASFVMRQPVVRADSDMDDVAAPSDPAPRTDADSLTSLELEYEHLQSALHSLQQHYSEQLAHEIEQKVCELDVALALTLGVEPEAAVLNRLSDDASEGDGAASSSTSSVLAHSRELAAQHQVSTLPQTLYQRHAASLARFRSHFTPVADEHRKNLSVLQSHMQSNETKLSAILDRNHLEVTRKRDEQVRAAIAAAKAAEEARLKKLEEERLAKEAAEKAKAEAEAAAKKAAEEAAAKKAQADKDAKDKSDAAAAAGKAAADSAAVARPAAAGPAMPGPSPAAAQEMAARIAHLTACRASFAGFVSSLEMKPARLKIMMAINRAIQQISGTLLQVQSKARELLTLLGMAKAASANTGGDQYHYCLDLIATKIVAQAYAKVRLMHDAAFPFAKVALMIALDHPLFTDIFLGCLGEKCTYIAPQYLERKAYKDLPSYQRALGYAFLDPPDGAPPGTPQTAEGEEQYFERMSGYVALYAAFVSEGAAVPNHPHGIGAAWVWVARVANQNPRTATAAILHAFLNQCAWSLHVAYPHQLPKLLHAINTDLLLKLDSSTASRKAAQAVLALWLQTTLHQLTTYGRFEEPKGMTMPHTQEADAGRQEVHEGDKH